MKSEISTDELQALTKSLFENPELANDLTDEQVIAIRKYVNPYGTIISAEESYANISIINWRDEFMKRFHMMSLTGFLFRMLEEYTDKSDLAQCRDQHDKHIETKLTNLAPTCSADDLAKERAKLEAERDEELALRTKVTKQIIGRFLSRNFEFNPDRHVREVGRGGKDPIVTLEKLATAEAVSKDVAAEEDDSLAVLRATAAATNESIELIRAAASVADADTAAILTRKVDGLKKLAGGVLAAADAKSAADVLPALKHIPPADTLYNYSRYVTNNYSRLREAYSAMFHEQPDIELGVIYYNAFPNEEAARNHRIQHANEFKAEVVTVSNNGITLLGPFKENNSRIDFYNKNTEILKQMMEQMEKDHKLGKDLMEKKVKRKKAMAIRRDGPDSSGLAAYSRTAGAIASGLVSTTADSSSTVAETPADDCPEDAISVDVFYPNAEGKLEKTNFYTQAEAPLHLENNSDFTSTYQPKK